MARQIGLEAAAGRGLNLNNLRVLRALMPGPLMMFQIAQALDLSKQAVSYNTTKLIEKGLIRRGDDLAFAILPAGKKAVGEMEKLEP